MIKGLILIFLLIWSHGMYVNCQYKSDEPVKSIFECCTESSAQLVISCVNRSSQLRHYEISSQIPYLKYAEGPKLIVSLLSRSTSEIFGYAAWSHFLQEAYASHNGYIFQLSGKRYTNTEDFTHYPKLAFLLEQMEHIDDHSDYIVWLDADFKLRLEVVAANHPTADLIMSADVSTIANTGFILLRNSVWAQAFLREWLALRLRPGIHNDQMGFDLLYKSRPKDEMLRKVAILPPDALNSDAPPMGRQKPHNQVLHLAAEHNEMRSAVFGEGVREICAAADSGRQTAPQLGLSRAFLQQTAMKVYLTRAEASIVAVNVSKAFATTAQVAELRQVVSKYCHAVAYANNDRETPATQRLRRTAYNLVTSVVEAQEQLRESIAALQAAAEGLRRSQSQKSSTKKSKKATEESRLDGTASLAISHLKFVLGAAGNGANSIISSRCELSLEAEGETDEASVRALLARLGEPESECGRAVRGAAQRVSAAMPELLKLACEVAQEHLGSLGILGAASGERKAVGAYIEATLEKLLGLVHPTQQNLVKDMQAGLFSQFGEAALREQDVATAIPYLQKAIAVQDDLRDNDMSATWDMRGSFQTMALLANALCMDNKFEEGISRFEAVIREEGSHVGPRHHNLLTKYANLGVCLKFGGRPAEAKKALETALELVEASPAVPSDAIKEQVLYHLQQIRA